MIPIQDLSSVKNGLMNRKIKGSVIVKHKNLIVISMLSIFMFIIFIGCGDGDITSAIYNNDKKLAETSDSWSLFNNNQSIENNEFNGTYELSGCGTIWRYSSDEQFDLQVPYNLTVNSGKAKLILITPDNEVKTLVENTSKSPVKYESTFTLPIEKGLNRIKLVGSKKANIQVQLKIDEGTFEKIEF